MPLLPASKKAEAFAALLEGSPDSSGQLATLGNLAQRLSSVPQPRPDFIAALRDQLMSQAAGSLPGAVAGTGAGAATTPAATPPTAAPVATAPAATTSAAAPAAAGATGAGSTVTSALATAASSAWLPFTSFVAATGVAISGVAAGASISLPGEPLYGVKRQIETIQEDLAGGRVDTARAQLGFAAARLNEFRALLRENGDAPLSADLNQRLQLLLENWAAATSQGTTTLLAQLTSGQGDVNALRATLVHFTDTQARGLVAAVQQLPDTALQSYTGSAFAYLQRVDSALGNPVQVARLLPALGLALPSVSPSAAPPPNGSSSTPPSTAAPGTPNPGGSTARNTPTSVPTLPIPTGGRPVPRSSIPAVPLPVPLPTGGSIGSPTDQVGGVVGGAAGTARTTVDNVLGGVTGNGPALPLPTSVPVPGR